jgi:hypothetical protein
VRTLFAFGTMTILLAVSASAQDQSASRHNDNAITVMLDARCDVFTLTYNRKTEIYGSNHSQSCAPQAKPIGDIGVVIHSNKPPYSAARAISIGETVTNGDGSQIGYEYLLDYPLVTGGQWTAYSTTDGINVGLEATGTYSVSK